MIPGSNSRAAASAYDSARVLKAIAAAEAALRQRCERVQARDATPAEPGTSQQGQYFTVARPGTAGRALPGRRRQVVRASSDRAGCLRRHTRRGDGHERRRLAPVSP